MSDSVIKVSNNDYLSSPNVWLLLLVWKNLFLFFPLNIKHISTRLFVLICALLPSQDLHEFHENAIVVMPYLEVVCTLECLCSLHE
uniref:Uncharacterized protein n=1 Tax=Rhizophora mucronata TaxID=61149 RepID=A0A2P2NT35_RHIMU